jgi:hypothetical protein
MSLTTPVAFIIFNRPDTTERVFEAIRQAKPLKLLVVADGPRTDRPDEVEKCVATRAVIDRVDWECEVLTNYSDINLGCKRRVSSGIDWVFSLVEEAIILEDDCLPAPSFFQFCQTLLEKYRYDDRIMHIDGTNLQFGQTRTPYSYYFSKYPGIWGWASWRRAWQHYDVGLKSWEEFKKSQAIESVHISPYEQKYWVEILDRVHQGKIDTWDYQWNYTCWSQGGLSIVPEVNLVTNIGFRPDATHTTHQSNLAALPLSEISQLEHPPFIVAHRDADEYIFDCLLGGKGMVAADSLVGKVRTNLSTLKRRLKNVAADPMSLPDLLRRKIGNSIY